MMIEWIPIIGILASSATAIWIVAVITRSRQARVEAQVQMQSKLIERFGSAPELVQFLQSEAGQKFVSGVTSAPTFFARERIVSGFTRAIIMTALGLAFVFLAAFQDESGWIVPAAVVFALGLGYLAATFVTYRFAAKVKLEETGA
jgi:hypothetical protein